MKMNPTLVSFGRILVKKYIIQYLFHIHLRLSQTRGQLVIINCVTQFIRSRLKKELSTFKKITRIQMVELRKFIVFIYEWRKLQGFWTPKTVLIMNRSFKFTKKRKKKCFSVILWKNGIVKKSNKKKPDFNPRINHRKQLMTFFNYKKMQ